MPICAARKWLDLLGKSRKRQELACPNAGNAAAVAIASWALKFGGTLRIFWIRAGHTAEEAVGQNRFSY
jgi:hypothetical protein